MPPQGRFLQSSSGNLPAVEPPEPMKVDSDVVVILAALLCALICVVGLALALRCAWLRNTLAANGGASSLNIGFRKKELRSLPKSIFDGEVAASGRLADCPICLAEFVLGDEIRVLPQCGHGFHVRCVDTWLRSHSSCPFCRQVLVVSLPSRCHLCGGSSSSGEISTAARSDYAANAFLP